MGLHPDSVTGAAAPAPDPEYTFNLGGGDTVSVIFVPLDSLFGSLWVDTASVPLTVGMVACPQANATDADSALVTVRIGQEGGLTPLDSAEVVAAFSASGPFEECSLATLRVLPPAH